MKKSNTVTGIVMLAISVFAYIYSSGLKAKLPTDPLGPSAWPKCLSLALGFFSIILLLQGILTKKENAKEEPFDFKSEGFLRVCKLCGVLIAFVALAYVVGIYIALVFMVPLTMYILAGQKALTKAKEVTLPKLRADAAAANSPGEAQRANDYANMCDRFEKKLHDLELTRVVCLQMAPQIRMIQNNNTLMSEKIQTSLVSTIPLWKSQMVLALGIDDSRKALEAQRQVTDMTNALLRKNADLLKTATLETARESERGIVDMETLQHTNEQLVATLDEVLQIQTEGAQQRAAAEAELRRIEGALKQKLLQGISNYSA